MNVTRDDFVFIDITWKGGFKHTVPCRGYNFKSQIKFNESIFWIEKFTWRIVTEKEYNAKLWAPLEENDNERGKRKGKALEETATKRQSRSKANEDSKAVRSTSKRTASSSKEARTELREPKVRTVRKPKKVVARTNDSGKASLPRSRSSKSKTQ
jgi:hypothetical protein